MRILLAILLSGWYAEAMAIDPSNKQNFVAKRVQDAPKVDGDLSDAIWNKNTQKIQFHQFLPKNGSPSEFQTSVQIVYTDQAMYIAASLYDPEPEKILKEFGQRDDFDRNADWFGVLLDPYNSGINAFTFLVSAAGVQGDYFLTVDDFDENWDAVWKSAMKITEHGWTVEMAIPYYAIRFPKKDIQTWGINFYRNVKRKQEESYWNYVDNGVLGVASQSGLLTGLEKIEPPLRLSFSPYVTSLYTHDGHSYKSKYTLTGGMDLKYGINESFTLDMSLIPDFSQVQSDNIVYNLTPYEVQYNENRQFFTEGTDLFNKSGLFYSRRIGQTVGTVAFDETTEEIVKSPTSTNLLNATKISGRNKNGLGLGLFNAVTKETVATIRNKSTGELRETKVDPVTNFNVIVVDKNLKNNSNVNFTNTSVLRADGGRDANVSSVSSTLRDKSNTYQISTFAALSNVMNEKEGRRHSQYGYKYTLDLGKISGKWQYGVTRNVESETYNPRDLGFLRAANKISHSAFGRYSILKPKGIINNMNTNVNLYHEYLYNPFTFTQFRASVSNYTQFKNFWAVGLESGIDPVQGYDYFEPRETGKYFIQPSNYFVNLFMESDSRKALAVSFYRGYWQRPAWNQSFNWWGGTLRYRVNNKLSFNLEVNDEVGDSRGYVLDQPDLGYTLFGLRELSTVTNIFGFNYTFSKNMGVKLRVRHNWMTVRYQEYFELLENGDLASSTYAGVNNLGEPVHNTNFNAVNIDLVYFWQIAPGSFINIVWKDAVQTFTSNTDISYFNNLQGVSKDPQVNSVSIRLTYFVDYLTLRKRLLGK